MSQGAVPHIQKMIPRAARMIGETIARAVGKGVVSSILAGRTIFNVRSSRRHVRSCPATRIAQALEQELSSEPRQSAGQCRPSPVWGQEEIRLALPPG